MNQFIEDTLLAVARRVHEQMTEFLPDLGDFGLTKQELDDFAALNEAFEAAKNELSLKVSEREFVTKDRIEKGNELYKSVVEFCEIGKRVYAKKNTAKYNDYIIYTPSAGGLKPPTGLNYLLEHNTAVWDAVENATSYELQYSPDEKTWSEAYGGADNMVHYFPPQSGTAFFRCRARNANGYGEYSEVLKTEIPLPS